jgi:hypothetical protein
MKKTIFVLTAFFLSILLYGQTLLDTAVNFTVKDVYGNTFKLFDILDEDKIVVIDFFSTA